MKFVQTLVSVIVILLMFGVNVAAAQQGGGGGGGTGGGGTTGGGGLTGGGTTGGGTTGGGSTGGGGGGTAGGGGGTDGMQSLDLGQSTFEFMDISNQAYVGATSAVFQETGFVGATSLSLGGTDSAVFGGGINNSSGTGGGGGARATGGGRNTGLAGGGGFGGGFGAGSGLVNQVTRAGVRAALVNRINITRPTNMDIAVQFTSRLDRIPAVRNEGAANVSVSVNNGTATVTGTPATLEQADRIIRQLKLEPGVYRVDNQMTAPARN